MQEVIGEILLDHMSLVAATDHEFIDAVSAVDLEDMPKDRLAADFHHRLR